eukprot:8896760-Karenia_brevis.AAC.1
MAWARRPLLKKLQSMKSVCDAQLAKEVLALRRKTRDQEHELIRRDGKEEKMQQKNVDLSSKVKDLQQRLKEANAYGKWRDDQWR